MADWSANTSINSYQTSTVTVNASSIQVVNRSVVTTSTQYQLLPSVDRPSRGQTYPRAI